VATKIVLGGLFDAPDRCVTQSEYGMQGGRGLWSRWGDGGELDFHMGFWVWVYGLDFREWGGLT